MFSRDRRRARLVSDYADSLIVRRRMPSEAGERAPTSSREDFAELLDLVRALDDLNIVAPDAPGGIPWRDGQVGASPASRRSDQSRLPASRGWLVSVGWRPVLTIIAIAVSLVVALSTRGAAPPLSADDLLKESEVALDDLLGSGHGLYRVWDASYRIEEPDQRVTSWNASIHEWIEGRGRSRLARRAVDQLGRVFWVQVTDPEADGGMRARQYFTPNNPVEPRGLVTVDATATEHREALNAFDPEDRSALEQFFLRSYGPGIAGERAYNRAILEAPGAEKAEPVLSLMGGLVDGVRMHQVEIFEPRRLWFTRSADGALAASLVRFSQTRFISPQSRLTVKFVNETVADNGRKSTTSWVIRSAESRRLSAGDEQAFTLDVPADVPVRRASARDDLARMLPAFRALRAEQSTRMQSSPATGIKRP
jgi:hypothetical protein